MSMIINSYSFGGYTARTTAFLAATGITDTTIANALNAMDLALIAAGLDTKMYALYPIVGGTATTHKYNFMNPADTDAAFRLTFSGGWTHSATGALPNGTTGYANTHLTPSVTLSQFSLSIGYYSRTTPYAAADQAIWGAWDVATKGQILADIYTNGTRIFGGMNDNYMIDGALSGTTKLLTICRTANNSAKVYRDGTALLTFTSVSTSNLTTIPIYIGGGNRNSSLFYPTKYECALSFISDSLNDTDNTNLATLVNTFETSLSRNV